MKKHMKLLPVYIILLIVLVFCIVWGYTLIKCEILTGKYYDEFENAYQSNTMLDDMEYFRVLNCDGVSAKVYYVSRGMTEAHVLTFEKENGLWKELSWETIWSDSGSASHIIWPYWWHFIYGGF